MNDCKSLVLEGRISTHSGKLLIIDPCYLRNFNYDKAMDRLNEPLDSYMEERPKQECALLDKLAENVRNMNRIVEGESSPGERRGILRKVAHDTKAYQLFKKRKPRRPKMSPPYLLQEQLFVLFHNPIGDGYYPITQTDQRIYVVFNYPLKPSEKGAKLDESRLEGKLVGRSMVDSGTQIITDSENFKIQSDVHPENYSLVEVPKGFYRCRFIRESSQLSIREAGASTN